ncbi:hypothetical protein NUW58_g7467 [Xylaria curta]|uniref:Uncharacterized protein n=1 Tax=Xylaria curta TaxID=42375 RepID=A0ACC1NGR0_9PEZI|nr:hypothetical protein NUW58_g7467 [Xylaria curta]
MDCESADDFLLERAGDPYLLQAISLPPPRPLGPQSILDNLTTDVPSNEVVNSGPVGSKVLPGTDDHHYGPESTDTKQYERKTPNREKRFGVADPLAWDVISRSLTQQRRLSSLIGIDNLVVVPAKQSSKQATSIVSRTSSQRRALNRFERELEKYADAAGAAGKAPVITPTMSDSKASIHTVKPLVPYKDEFLAAGLAVTSAEQNRKLTGKTHAQSAPQRNRPPKHSTGPSQARKMLDLPGGGTSSSTSTIPSCTSSGSYVEFSPPSGHMLHAIESIAGHHFPVPIQHVKGGQVKSNDLSSAQHEHRRLQHRSHRPTMQSIPELQLRPKPALPAKYVTPKLDPCVALATSYCERSDQGPHPEQGGGHEGEHYHSIVDAKQSPGEVRIQGKRDITRGVLPKPYPEPIGTIEEETELSTQLVDKGARDHCLPPIDQKGVLSVKQGDRQRRDAKASVTHESSVASLPFAARLATSTSSSLQRALDDACRRLDNEDRQPDNISRQENRRQEPSPIPWLDSRNNVSTQALPRKPRSTEEFIYVKRSMPKVEVLQSISKPLPPEPAPALSTVPAVDCDKRVCQPSRQAPPIPPAPRALTGKRKDAVAELARAEEMLKDLDVFLNDYDDADIEDRDVIKGLQVAIHAAADDLYDGYIRHKTGLRIRRFLADLKSFEEVSELGPTDRRARERRAKSRKLKSLEGRKNHR